MKKASNISGLTGKAGQRGRFLLGSSFTLIGGFLVLGSLTIWFYQLSIISGWTFFKFLAYLSGMLATGAFLAGFALLAARGQDGKKDRILAALRSILKGPGKDPDARVRAEAAKELAKLDLEESSLHNEHEELNTLLISTLNGDGKDPAPTVRFEATKGLAKVELEQHSYHHKHRELDDYLFEHDVLQ